MEALRAVADREADPLDDVEATSALARDRLASVEPARSESEPVQEPTPSTPPQDLIEPSGEEQTEGLSGPLSESEIVSGLAGALHDPDEGVRAQARKALGEVDRGALLVWTREALQNGDHATAALAASVAEAASLHEAAGSILGRSSSLSSSLASRAS